MHMVTCKDIGGGGGGGGGPRDGRYTKKSGRDVQMDRYAGVDSSPDPDSQQLRVDYITATWKVGLGNKNDALVLSVPQCLCPKIVRQSKFRTNLAQLESNKRYHFRMILLRGLCICNKQISKFTQNNYLSV